MILEKISPLLRAEHLFYVFRISEKITSPFKNVCFSCLGAFSFYTQIEN